MAAIFSPRSSQSVTICKHIVFRSGVAESDKKYLENLMFTIKVFNSIVFSCFLEALVLSWAPFGFVVASPT